MAILQGIHVVPQTPDHPARPESNLTDDLLADIRARLAADTLELPSLPQVVLRVQAAAARPDVKTGEIAQLITTDPAITTRLLRIANSAYYRGSQPIADMNRAVVRLGLRTVKNLLAAVAIERLYANRHWARFEAFLTELWNRSVLVASLCEGLSSRAPGQEPEVAMLAGLLHRVGALPVLEQLVNVPGVDGQPEFLLPLLAEVESEVAGTILERWDFPPELLAVVTERGDLTRSHGGLPDYVDTVQVAEAIVTRDAKHPTPHLGELPAAAALGVEDADTEALLDAGKARFAVLSLALT